MVRLRSPAKYASSRSIRLMKKRTKSCFVSAGTSPLADKPKRREANLNLVFGWFASFALCCFFYQTAIHARVGSALVSGVELHFCRARPRRYISNHIIIGCDL